MKPLYFILIVILALCMLLLPLLCLNNYEGDYNLNLTNQNTVKVFLKDQNQVLTVDKKSYIFSAVSNTLSGNANKDAITAVALSFSTYIDYQQKNYPGRNFDINDFDQNFIPEDKLIEKLKTAWGENYEENKKMYLSAIETALKYSICYNKEPIMALTHKMSGGKTENAKDILNQDIPYLTTVDSAGDLINPNFESKVTVSLEDFKEKLQSFNVNFTDDPKNFITNINKTPCGTITSLSVCGTQIKGEEFKNLFNLKSGNFTYLYNNSFIITAFGEGTALGLSISGAEYMANAGSSYTDIIKWYYKNTEIIKK